jgi:thiol-disulfide isomerase/thioredoxin
MNKFVLAVPAVAVIALAGCSSDTDTGSGTPDATAGQVVESPSAMEKSDEAMEPSTEAGTGDAMEKSDEAMEPSTEAGTGDAMEKPDDGDPAGGEYVTESEYRADPAAYQDGNSVLFFYAAWCPDCQGTDASIKQTGVPDDINVVKIDYDTANDLRKKYGVTQQHTFVLIGEGGEELKKWTGSDGADDIASQVS